MSEKGRARQWEGEGEGGDGATASRTRSVSADRGKIRKEIRGLTTNRISHSYPLSLNPFMNPANQPQSVKLPSMTKLLLLSFATAAHISCKREASGWRREEAVSGE